jgi:hypothetical protein
LATGRRVRRASRTRIVVGRAVVIGVVVGAVGVRVCCWAARAANAKGVRNNDGTRDKTHWFRPAWKQPQTTKHTHTKERQGGAYSQWYEFPALELVPPGVL